MKEGEGAPEALCLLLRLTDNSNPKGKRNTQAEELARVKRERASLMASLAAARGGAGGESGGGSKEGGTSPGAAAPSSFSTLLLSGAELQAADAARLRAEVATKRSALDAGRDESGRLELRLRRLRLDVAEASAGLREVAVSHAAASATATSTAAAKTSSSASTSASSSASTPRQLQLVLSPAAARDAELEEKLRACEATLDGDSARQRLYELLKERTR